MHPVLYALPLMTLVLVLATPAYAQTTHEILIPSGAADPNSPRFWYDVSTGNPTGEITILPETACFGITPTPNPTR